MTELTDSPTPIPSGPARARQIGFVLIPGHALMSAASAIEPLRAANLIGGRPLYDLHMLSVDGGMVSSSAGSLFPTRSIDGAGDAFDLVFVVAGGNPIGQRLPRLTSWLRRLDARGVRLGGISGGSAILAQAGLMKGRRFTVHWDHFDALRDLSEDFVMERRLFVIDRDRLSCAGGVAALDMIYALIAGEHGADLARRVGDWFIHTNIRPPGGPQRAGPVEQFGTHHAALLQTIEMMQTHVGDPLDAEQLAALAGISQRQLQRLFADRFGRPMMGFYRGLRLARADELLRQTQLSVAQIAQTCGFATASHFTRVFQQEYGVAPTRRREMHLSRGGRV